MQIPRPSALALPRRALLLGGAFALTAVLGLPGAARAADEAPDAWIGRLSQQVLQAIKSDKAMQAGDIDRIMRLVDEKIMPNINFRRMTASAVGPGWRQASDAQRKRLEQEFKLLLVRTYAGALKQVKDQTIEIRPLSAKAASDDELTVRTLIQGGGTDAVQLDYRLEKTPGNGAGWKIYDLNVMGVWLIATYRPQFAQQVNQAGIDGLIASLAARNKSNTGNAGK